MGSCAEHPWVKRWAFNVIMSVRIKQSRGTTDWRRDHEMMLAEMGVMYFELGDRERGHESRTSRGL